MKMSRCEDEKMRRCEYVRMRRCEDLKMLCEDVKMFNRPPLSEEPFAQTLSGKIFQNIEAGQAGDSGLLVYVGQVWKTALNAEAHAKPGLYQDWPQHCAFLNVTLGISNPGVANCG